MSRQSQNHHIYRHIKTGSYAEVTLTHTPRVYTMGPVLMQSLHFGKDSYHLQLLIVTPFCGALIKRSRSISSTPPSVL